MSDSPTDWVRVTDLDSGHKLTIRRAALPHGNYRELKSDAVDLSGDPLPVEHNAVEPLSSTTTSGQEAETKKEKANG